MPKVIILGSANAIPDEEHENTHMAIVGQQQILLIDCVSNPIVRLHKAGLDTDRVSDLILTHFHPDHVSGVPLLLMNLWLLGRKKPLNLYGLAYTLERVKKMMDDYDWASWPNFFPISFNNVPAKEMAPVLENAEWRVFASPVKHLVPNIGLRVEFLQVEKQMAYSCDTEPCPQVVRLARGVDVLIHEASGGSLGHTSPAQAGEIALEAGARSLYLIHYPTNKTSPKAMVDEATASFQGPVALAQDFMKLEF
jgi:ribonuclease Z